MILSIVLSLGPLALRIFKPQLMPATALLTLSVVCFLLYHPIAVEGRFINSLTLNRKTSQCMNFLSKLNDRNILIIDSRPGQDVAIGYGAIDFAYANQNSGVILLEFQRHLDSRLIVFQEISYQTGQPIPDAVLHPDYKLNTLYEIQNTATEFLRISEVKRQNQSPKNNSSINQTCIKKTAGTFFVDSGGLLPNFSSVS